MRCVDETNVKAAMEKLKKMGIKTIIDLRTEREREKHPSPDDLEKEFNVLYFPILAFRDLATRKQQDESVHCKQYDT